MWRYGLLLFNKQGKDVMLVFTYWSNETKHHDLWIYTLFASSLSEADSLFESEYGIKPSLTP